MYAIIETGGKQYRVQNGDVIFVEKLNAQADEEITFDKVIAVSDKTLKVGKPYVHSALRAEFPDLPVFPPKDTALPIAMMKKGKPFAPLSLRLYILQPTH